MAADCRCVQSLWGFLRALGVHISDMSGVFRETEILAVSTSWVVELRGLCAGRSARSNRCKSDAMKE